MAIIWQPKKFDLECTTIWSFSRRGRWATHSSSYRGNWSPQVVRNLLLRYSEEGDLVLNPMAGGGTTLIECKLTGRRGFGVDINPARNGFLGKKFEALQLPSDNARTFVRISETLKNWHIDQFTGFSL